MPRNSIPSRMSGPICANRLAISVLETYQEIVTQCCDAWNFSANDTATVRSITRRDYAKAVRG